MAKKDRSVMADVRDNKRLWESRVRSLTLRGQAAADTGDLVGAEEYLRRAKIAKRALERWERIEQSAIAAGHSPIQEEQE